MGIMKSCTFCSIAAGDAPAQRVANLDGAVAIRPLLPVTPGHLLVIPFEHVEDFRSDPEVTGRVAREAAVLAEALGGQWNLITSAGPDATQTVFHLHVHLVPRRLGDGLTLPWTPVPDLRAIGAPARHVCRRCLADDHAFCLGETICPCGRADHALGLDSKAGR